MKKNVNPAPSGGGLRDRRRTVRAAFAAAAVTALVGSVFTAATGNAAPRSVDPVPSAGCGPAAPAPGETSLPFAAAGKSGTYIQDVPPAAVSGRPTPVVFDLHGYLEPGFLEHEGTGLSGFGDSHGFITVTPDLDEPGVPRWDVGKGSPDIAFLSGLLTHVERSLCVDERRVYVAGLSMGAFAASSIACQLSDRVAAVAPVAGAQAFRWCRPARAVPAVIFHGTGDPFLAFGGGLGPVGRLLPSFDGPVRTMEQVQEQDPTAQILPDRRSIPTQVAVWARRNGCGPTPTVDRIASDVTRESYPCPADADIDFYVIAGGGHTWPGSTSTVYPAPLVGTTTRSISANQVMWDFFRTHPLTGPVGG